MAVQISVTIKGAEVYQSKLHTLDLKVQEIPARVVRDEMEQARDEARTYPDELPNQRYVRTGKRYARTRVEARVGNNQYSKTYVVISDPRYAKGRSADPYVLGDARGRGQARIHWRRWAVLYERVQEALLRVRVKAWQMIGDAWRK